MSKWFPENSPTPVDGNWLWEYWQEVAYPNGVPSIPHLLGFQRENNLDGEGWQCPLYAIEDEEIEIPPASDLSLPAPGPFNQIQLLKYPSDEAPEGSLFDPVEVWTGNNRTGTQFTLVGGDTISGPVPENSFIIDYATGLIRFSDLNAGEKVYVSYFPLQGAVRPAFLNYLQGNITSIADALLNGLQHGLKFTFDWGSGDVKIIDVSGMTGFPASGDWLFYGGDYGGTLARPFGLAADGFLYANGIIPIVNRVFGSIGQWADPNTRFAEGAFIDLKAEALYGDVLRTPIIRPDETTEDITIDLASVAASELNITGQGNAKITITDESKVAIETDNSSDTAVEIGGLSILGSGRIDVARDNTNVSECQCWPLQGDCNNLIGYTESNAINAVMWTYGNECLTRFLGSSATVFGVQFEFITTVAADYISKIEVIEKASQAIGVVSRFSQVGTWGQGNTGQQSILVPITPEIVMARRYGVRITCTNATADSIRLQSAFIRFAFKGI